MLHALALVIELTTNRMLNMLKNRFFMGFAISFAGLVNSQMATKLNN